ncbi:MAG: type I secretion C-terminal target domain-containing protein [Hyphomicrobiales bacterium]
MATIPWKGAGLDRLDGGRGKDTLYGGDGQDVFDFNSIKDSVKGSKRDTIEDFTHGANGDVIDLEDIDAKTGGGNQKFKFIGEHGFHGKKGELHFKDLGAKCLVSGDVNGDGKADFEIMVKTDTLSADDFLL